ncbi:Cilia- and flagella-associated protein 251 [Acarospora aff. strigata]|nr:Cilia- and flagella-associated protein 251 [Acarospora aff. strigata]
MLFGAKFLALVAAVSSVAFAVPSPNAIPEALEKRTTCPRCEPFDGAKAIAGLYLGDGNNKSNQIERLIEEAIALLTGAHPKCNPKDIYVYCEEDKGYYARSIEERTGGYEEEKEKEKEKEKCEKEKGKGKCEKEKGNEKCEKEKEKCEKEKEKCEKEKCNEKDCKEKYCKDKYPYKHCQVKLRQTPLLSSTHKQTGKPSDGICKDIEPDPSASQEKKDQWDNEEKRHGGGNNKLVRLSAFDEEKVLVRRCAEASLETSYQTPAAVH